MIKENAIHVGIWVRFWLEIQSEKRAGKDPTNLLPHLPKKQYLLYVIHYFINGSFMRYSD